jgi:pyruvate dehydrogenase E2 component (dihydrolipoamide acetyltransferase)
MVKARAVVMPKAGISVESCIIGRWHKNVGDTVSVGDVLFDYETDKASFECESTEAGTLLEIFFEGGDEVACLVNVCAIGEAGDEVDGLRPVPAPEDGGRRPEAGEIAAASDDDFVRVDGVGVSPRAKKLAARLDVDPFGLPASGPRGRVIERDIYQGARSEKKEARVAVSDSEYVDEKFSKVRKVIAAGMFRSLSETAQLTHHHSFDAAALLELRKGLKGLGGDSGLSGVTINDLILYVVSRVLLSHPSLNAHMLGGDTLRKFSAVNLGVAMDTPRGLIVPTVFNADKMSVKEISDEVKRLGAMARDGNISPDLLQGATFTVSNLGNLGVEMFTPIINPPQVAVLGVCGVFAKVREGVKGIETYQSMGLSLTYDHRAVDGAPASRFAGDLCRGLENIALLLLAEQEKGERA